VRQDRLRALWLLYATTGGGAESYLGLSGTISTSTKPSDHSHTHVEVGGKIVHARPKTDSGVRTISLDATTVSALKRHRKNRKPIAAVGAEWHNTNHVFVREKGEPCSGSRLTQLHSGSPQGARGDYRRKGKDKSLPVISLHGLRTPMRPLRSSNCACRERRLKASGHKNETVTLTCMRRCCLGTMSKR